MFTGIITDIGTVRGVEQRGDLRLTIGTAFDTATIDLGASIACSGACLTVVDKGEDWFAVDVSAETVACTVAGLWQEDAKLNLERALRLGDEFGGHIVTGHVDGIGEVIKARPDGASTRIDILAPADLGPYIAVKGSITLDGVSLTINELSDADDGSTHFSVNIIPHTAAHSTFGEIDAGRSLNIEIDVIARYLKRMADARKGAYPLATCSETVPSGEADSTMGP